MASGSVSGFLIRTGNSNIMKETSRIEAFSDGVFAIAITLLILEIHVPTQKENETLFSSLLHEWPSFLALLVGFFTLLICWINHHYMFSMIYKSNSVLSLINGFKLLIVTITPFATALLSKNIQSAWEHNAVSVYCFNFALMGSAMTGIWLYSKRKGFAKTDSERKLTAITRLYIFAGLLSMTIWLVSYVSIIGSMILFVVMFIIYVFPEKIVAWQMQTQTHD
jgi:uncharacterized membrane protein